MSRPSYDALGKMTQEETQSLLVDVINLLPLDLVIGALKGMSEEEKEEIIAQLEMPDDDDEDEDEV